MQASIWTKLENKMADCLVLKPGLLPYQEAWELQKSLAQGRRAGQVGDMLILLEHPPTYTLGRRGVEAHLLVGEERLSQLGASVHWVDRGGDVTYHGPGQLVGYPILNLQRWGNDVYRYMRNLEEVLIRALSDLSVQGERLAGYTGVWVGKNKIAALGVKVSEGITTHGFALNVNTDLTYFDHIVPCGLQDKGVTSIGKSLGRAMEMDVVAKGVEYHFGQVFGLRMKEGALEEISDLLGSNPENVATPSF